MKLSTVLAFTLVVGCVAGCSGTADFPGDALGSSADELRESVLVGSFKLYKEPHHAPSPPCDIHTKLDFVSDDGGRVTASLKEKLDGVCLVYVEPGPRSYALSFLGTSCGSRVYVDRRRTVTGTVTLRITDHRTRVCRDIVPARIVVDETSASGTIRALYTSEYAPEYAPEYASEYPSEEDSVAGRVPSPAEWSPDRRPRAGEVGGLCAGFAGIRCRHPRAVCVVRETYPDAAGTCVLR